MKRALTFIAALALVAIAATPSYGQFAATGGGFTGGTVGAPVTIDTSTLPALTVDYGGAQNGTIARIIAGSSTTQNEKFTGLSIDLQANVTPSGQTQTGLAILIDNTAAAQVTGAGALYIDSNATLQRVVDIDVANTSGNAQTIRWGSSTTLTGNVFGLHIDGTNVSVPSGTTFYGLHIECAVGTNDTSAGIGIRCDNSIGNLAWRGIDIETTRTFTASADNGLIGSHAFVFLYNTPVASGASTTLTLRSPIVYINHAPTTAAGGTVTDTTPGISVTMTPASASAVKGIVVNMSANTTANANGVAALVIDSQMITARSVDIAVANTSSTAFDLRWRGNTTLSAATRAMLIDMGAINVPGANACIGLSIVIPATTATNAASEAALAIDSNATQARVIDIDVANKNGSIVALRYGSAATLDALVYGINVDLTTNVSHAGFRSLGIRAVVGSTTSSGSADSSAGLFEWANTTGASLGSVLVQFSSNPTLSTGHVGIGVDLTGCTNSAQQTTGLQVSQITSSTSTQRVTHAASNNGAVWTEGWWSELLTLSTSGATTNTTNAIPANSFIEGVTARITTTIAGVTSTSWQVGDSTTATRFGSTAALTSGTTIVGMNHLQGAIATDAAGPIVTASTTVRITLAGGGDNTPSAGVVRITARYRTYGAETSFRWRVPGAPVAPDALHALAEAPAAVLPRRRDELALAA